MDIPVSFVMLPAFVSYVYRQKWGSKAKFVIKYNTNYFSWKIYKCATLARLQQKQLLVKLQGLSYQCKKEPRNNPKCKDLIPRKENKNEKNEIQTYQR